METLAQQIDFESLGIKRSDLEKVTVLRQRESHTVYRLRCKGGNYILKWFNSPSGNKELRVYTLLENYGVETLPIHKRTECALLLADLQSSSSWRLAKKIDLERSGAGRAVANWYRNLHCAGREALKDQSHQPTYLSPWVNSVSQESLTTAGNMFSLGDEPVWDKAVASIEILKAKYLELPQTFNYNDFAAENLALSRKGGYPLRAIVFDYDWFTTGLVYSDWRNVVFSLRGAAKAAFTEIYRPISEKERLLDEPLDMLYGIVIASKRRNTPNWVAPYLEAVATGRLERCIIKALEVS